MRLVITQRNIGEWAADFVKWRMEAARPRAGRPFVFGLPTGESPKGMYRALIAKHAAGEMSFKHTVTFNMDEYVGLPPEHPKSYRSYMFENFFNHIDIPRGNIHIPDGTAPDLEAECEAYERAIKDAGGVNLFIGGVGRDGHLAFNEPGSSLASRTREKVLMKTTIRDNAAAFGGDESAVPRSALTVGIGTIMDAQEVLVLVSGASKADALHAAIEGGVSHMWPISALQVHPKAVIVADEDAVRELKVKTVRYFALLQDEYSWLD